MQFLVICRPAEGGDQDEFRRLVPFETEALRELKAKGLLTEAWSPGRPGAVLVLDVAGEPEAARLVAEFPLVQAGLISTELIPLHPIALLSPARAPIPRTRPVPCIWTRSRDSVWPGAPGAPTSGQEAVRSMPRSSGLRMVLAVAGVAMAVGAGMAAPGMAGPALAGLALAATAGPGVWGFGTNGGDLGNGTTTDSSSPVAAVGLPAPARQVAGGYFTSAALLSDGTMWAWGSNASGVLGEGFTGGTFTSPRQVPGLSAVAQIALGPGDAYAVRSDGTVWAWGFNTSGQLGNGTMLNIYQPVRVPGLTGITQVAAYDASFAVRSDGTLFSWGDNSTGALGNGTSGGFTARPAPVPGLAAVTQVATSGNTTLALAGSGGTVWAWGQNDCGQFGDGTTVSRPGPEQTGLTGLIEVATGINGGSAGIRPGGTLLTWGCNAYGQLGNGTSGQFEVPPGPVRSLAGVSHVTFGGGAFGGYGLAVGSQAYATVPSLTGDTTTVAGQQLQAANLVLGTVSTQVDDSCDYIGRVIRQSPAAGTVLIGGSAVSVTVGVRPSHPCP